MQGVEAVERLTRVQRVIELLRDSACATLDLLTTTKASDKSRAKAVRARLAE